jgi:hypothetical protein
MVDDVFTVEYGVIIDGCVPGSRRAHVPPEDLYLNENEWDADRMSPAR